MAQKKNMHGADEVGFHHQDEVLDRSISLARQFGTDKVRCFDFWRLDNVTPYRAAINDVLQTAAEKAARQNILLVLENEFECKHRYGPVKPPQPSQPFPRETSRSTGIPAMRSCAANSNAYPQWLGSSAKRADPSLPCQKRDQGCDPASSSGLPVDVGYIDWTAQFRRDEGNQLRKRRQS